MVVADLGDDEGRRLVAEQLLAELKALGLAPRQGDEAPGGIGQRQDVALVVEVLGDARRRNFCFRCASVRFLAVE